MSHLNTDHLVYDTIPLFDTPGHVLLTRQEEAYLMKKEAAAEVEGEEEDVDALVMGTGNPA